MMVGRLASPFGASLPIFRILKTVSFREGTQKDIRKSRYFGKALD